MRIVLWVLLAIGLSSCAVAHHPERRLCVDAQGWVRPESYCDYGVDAFWWTYRGPAYAYGHRIANVRIGILRPASYRVTVLPSFRYTVRVGAYRSPTTVVRTTTTTLRTSAPARTTTYSTPSYSYRSSYRSYSAPSYRSYSAPSYRSYSSPSYGRR